ncbi:ComF family protein [Candidatus Saccharibacteria bacterium]|nr:ComF family protein [Candidatus Saccharibacteria bacterium]
MRRAISLWRLDTTSEDLVYGLKYEGREDIARSVAHYIEKNITLPRFDVITYVPSDPKRRRERGFAAPQLIARELSRISRKPYVALLSRDKHVPQVGLGRQERWRNVRGNFSHLNREVLVDRRILLIDDVITTGATITECAKTLKLAGSGPVYVLSVARK